VRAVCVGSVGAVGGAVGLDRVGHLHTQLDAFAPGRLVRDRLERCLVGFLDLGFLVRVDLGEDLPRRRRGRSVGRRAWGGRQRRDHAGVVILHRVDRVGHGDMHHS
jgi:hypothetical protein